MSRGHAFMVFLNSLSETLRVQGDVWGCAKLRFTFETIIPLVTFQIPLRAKNIVFYIETRLDWLPGDSLPKYISARVSFFRFSPNEWGERVQNVKSHWKRSYFVAFRNLRVAKKAFFDILTQLDWLSDDSWSKYLPTQVSFFIFTRNEWGEIVKIEQSLSKWTNSRWDNDRRYSFVFQA